MKKTAFALSAALLVALALPVIPALFASPAGAGAAPAADTGDAASRDAYLVSSTSVPTPGDDVIGRAPEPPPVPDPDFNPASFGARGLRPEVLDTALEAHEAADRHGLVERPEILTVIDYSLPSTAKRLWVLDLDRRRVLFHERTTHGTTTGGNYARRFSNVSMSKMSSLGLLTTAETYYGKNGYSLRMDGHEPGINDLARPRAIVIHGADYATQEFIDRVGRLGRSWGCPALDPEISRQLIDTIKDGSAVFGYYPKESYFAKSAFVGERSGSRIAAAP